MEKGMRSQNAHCLVLPFPTQGHINPMLQFSKRLQHKEIKVTLAITRFIFKTTKHQLSGSVTVETISDGYDEGGRAQAESREAYLDRLHQVGEQTLTNLVEKLRDIGQPVDCIVYDAFLPWALDVAKRFGLVGAAFLTQSCAVDNIYYHVYNQILKLPVTGPKVLVPGLPPLEPLDLPSFVYDFESHPPLYKLVMNQFSNIDKADWVLCNTFYELEKEVVDWMAKLWRLRTIGPTIPSIYLDKRIQDDKAYGLTMFKPSNDDCIKWLDEKPDGSVVYVSFGSLAELGIEQMEELAWGLRGSNKYFLWVVRASEEAKLPKDFVEETSKKGLVVSWCPQMEVLSHKAMGCFVTHCGWNSTLEALSLGVPMVAIPQWTDQTTNAKYVTDVWGMGLKAKRDEKGIVRGSEVEHCIREVTGRERGKEIKMNAIKWREMAKESVDEGGSSDRNIDDFAANLVNS
ncbi:mogroside IE synthase-like [Cornus florida]|uniref:mogroside IE synthase-like n=1 Tax=Cornus florida TaxID=4283 RepID=UPI002896E334|nr:mogroside IE synthase-like [Cornus florida]